MLSKPAQKIFSVLSIGQRGVGKTVFLAGSYAELHSPDLADGTQRLWFDCQDSQARENIEDVLNYIGETGKYPPPTMKVTNFNFSLKRHSLWGNQTLCNFRWWDIPGESCNVNNPDFRSIVLKSHGCCVFIDAYALVHIPTYHQNLEDIIEAVMQIANFLYMNSLKFPFALILTKCDLLELHLLSQQHFQERLHPLTIRLDSVKANYQMFYSNIPIVPTEGASILKAKGAAAPLLWLVQELSKVYKPNLNNNISEFIALLLPSRSQLEEDRVDGALEHSFKSTDKKTFGVKKILGLYLTSSDIQHILRLALVFLGLVGGASLFINNYERIFQRESNLDATHKAVAVVEKLVQKEPESLDLRLQLAQLYENTDQVAKAETEYEQILLRQKNNFKALIGKAVLRHAQGDTKTAKALFTQAEKAASTKLQVEQVRVAAQKTL